MDNTFLIALAATVVIETAVLFLGVRLATSPPRPAPGRIVLAGVLASSWSLPYFWYLLPRYVSGPAYVPVGEVLVTLGEAVVLGAVLGTKASTSLVLSAACNVGSWLSSYGLVRWLT